MKTKGKIFIKYFLNILFIFLIPICLLGVIQILNMQKQAEASVQTELEYALNSTKTNADRLLSFVESEVEGLAADLEYNQLYFSTGITFEKYMRNLAEIRTRLETVINTNGAVDSICLYAGQKEKALCNKGFYDLTDYVFKSDIETIMSAVDYNSFHIDAETGAILVARCLPMLRSHSSNFLYARIRAAEMEKTLHPGSPSVVAAVMDMSGNMLVDAPEWMNEVLSGDGGGYTARVASDVAPVVYVCAYPAELARARVNEYTRTLLYTIVLIALSGVVLAYLLANALYRPISDLCESAQKNLNFLARSEGSRKDELALLNQAIYTMGEYSGKMRKAFNLGRDRVLESMLRRCIKGGSVDSDELQEIVENYSFVPEFQYRVLSIQIVFTRSTYENDSVLNRLQIKRAILDALPGAANGEIILIFLGDGEYCCLIDKQAMADEGREWVRCIWENLRGIFSGAIYIGVGGLAQTLDAIANAYDEARRALGQLPISLFGGTAVYDPSFLPAQTHLDSAPHVERFVEAVLQQDEKAATRAIDAWLQDLDGNIHVAEARHDAMDFIGGVHHAFSTRAIGRQNVSSHAFYERIGALGDVSAMRDCLMDFARMLLSAQREQTSSNAVSFLMCAVEYVNENYREDISLTQVADTLNISPQYLSTSFKASVGVSFTEYVNSLRLKEGMRLVRETHCSVAEIATQVGYNSAQYFISRFKAAYGVTPAKFRESFSSSEELFGR